MGEDHTKTSKAFKAYLTHVDLSFFLMYLDKRIYRKKTFINMPVSWLFIRSLWSTIALW